MVVGEPQHPGTGEDHTAARRAAGTFKWSAGRGNEPLVCGGQTVRHGNGYCIFRLPIRYAAVELARKIFGSLEGKHIPVIDAAR